MILTLIEDKNLLSLDICLCFYINIAKVVYCTNKASETYSVQRKFGVVKLKSQIDIYKLEAGMVIAQNVLDKNGHLMVQNGTILTENIIERVRNVSNKRSLLVEFEDTKIGVVVEKVNKRLVELNSGQVQIADVKKRLEVKKKMREMEQAIENTFASLNLNENDENAKKK